MDYPRYGKLVLSLTGEGETVVDEPFYFERKSGVQECINPGFVTDGASGWPFIDPWGPWSEPAVVHDHDYRTKQIPRKEADQWFWKGLRAKGIGRIQAATFYNYVRGMGWLVY